MTFLWTSLLTTLITVSFTELVRAIAIDNGVIGSPGVTCREDGIRIDVKVEKPFGGHIYVKSQYATPGCSVSFVNSRDRPLELIFDVLFEGGCLVRRERSINPNGIEFKSTVIIQFHQAFVTKVDKAYSVTCLYQEVLKQLTQSIDVSEIATTELNEQQKMPTCSYEVLSESPSGALVRFARVGDKLVHKWSCVPAATHGILVHSCVARDGTVNEYELIDQNGCSTDPVGMGELTYTADLAAAWVQVHAFKFADRIQIQFECRISLCVKAGDGCDNFTPPNCPYPNGGNSADVERPPPDSYPPASAGTFLPAGNPVPAAALDPPYEARRVAVRDAPKVAPLPRFPLNHRPPPSDIDDYTRPPPLFTPNNPRYVTSGGNRAGLQRVDTTGLVPYRRRRNLKKSTAKQVSTPNDNVLNLNNSVALPLKVRSDDMIIFGADDVVPDFNKANQHRSHDDHQPISASPVVCKQNSHDLRWTVLVFAAFCILIPVLLASQRRYYNRMTARIDAIKGSDTDSETRF